MILFDTNILVYSRNKNDPRYISCRKIILKAEKGEIIGVISSQNISEFVSVSIKLMHITKHDTMKDILIYLQFLQKNAFKIIYPNNQTILIFDELLHKYKTTPKKVFDLFLIATMLTNGVNQILTYNCKDYSQFPEIKAIIPS